MVTLSADADATAIRALFDAQAATALALRESTAPQRRDKLRRLSRAVLARRERWYAAFHADLGKPRMEVELTELLPVLDEASHAIGHLQRWMRLRRIGATLTTLGTSARVQYQPRGRCLIIGPWNYPLNTVLGPLVSAVAAGNTAILKPSEFTPHVNALVEEVIAEVFGPQEVALVQGAVKTSECLLALPFDHIFFTGSPEVGKKVMAAAALHLTSVTLELGGKSPAIVDASADVEAAVRMLAWGKLTNAGQTCVAPDHVYVHQSVEARFIACWRRVVAERYGRNAPDVAASAHLGRMVTERHAERMAALIEDAVAKGATRLDGGEHDTPMRYVAPTLLGRIPGDARIASEEIFGPVLPLHVFDSVDEVVARINAAFKPLALYLFARDRALVAKLQQQTSSGSLGVNLCVQQYAHSQLPFGGVNHSGMGNAHGFYGFRAFSHERACLYNGPLNGLRLFFPPYSPMKLGWAQKLVKLIART
ncbi:aldehyde dehydrogenase family protein [Acidovorax sp. SUPP2825]|uniref:aldehyde dehydrogenase family protein n=1 Tax=Acidovorax sp. SUPP2825 TaxID=2920879 RepID=UPI0023DE6800|nr:aldehyde dehydrogenase family protein [Acidovorax sp. SUPP2825]GKS93475.1 aldehyde dehydrogenase family protein [Acidovorax sp. SUPP2825]